MKAFGEWWDKHRASISPHTCQSARRENLAQLADEEVWRAALEHVMDEIARIYMNDEGDKSLLELEGEIKRELEE